MLPDLPITEALPALTAALRAGSNALLIAPPGAGKTTLVPLVLKDEPWAAGRKILVLEPRRVAARAAARRMAELIGEAAPGGTIGLATRLDRAVSAATRVEVVTEGLLVRRLQSDPGLDGVAAVLFDEAHERNLDTDLALASASTCSARCGRNCGCWRCRRRWMAAPSRPDGARADRRRHAASGPLPDAPTIESLGRAWPVGVEHRPRDFQDPRDLPEAMAARHPRCAAGAPRRRPRLPAGLGRDPPHRRTAGGIEADIRPLHGEMPPAEQDLALNPGPRRKVVLATSIAETSLTVPGVRIVVDGGFRRAPRLDPATGLSRLVTVRICKAAAEQRAGRAGRTAPGVAIRLWSEALHRGLAPQDRPAILEEELSGLALDLAAWGAEAGRAGLARPAARRRHGRGPRPAGGTRCAGRRRPRHRDRAARWPGSAPIRGWRGCWRRPRREGEKAMAADLAALLEERDPIRGREAPADIGLRLDLLHGGDHPNADRPAIQRIRRAAALHRRRLGVHGASTRKAIPARCWPPASPTGSPPCAASWPAPSAWPPARAPGWR